MMKTDGSEQSFWEKDFAFWQFAEFCFVVFSLGLALFCLISLWDIFPAPWGIDFSNPTLLIPRCLRRGSSLDNAFYIKENKGAPPSLPQGINPPPALETYDEWYQKRDEVLARIKVEKEKAAK